MGTEITVEQLTAQLNAITAQVAILKEENAAKDQQIKQLAQERDKARYYLENPNTPRPPLPPPPLPPKTPEPEEPTMMEGTMTALLRAFLTKENSPNPMTGKGTKKC